MVKMLSVAVFAALSAVSILGGEWPQVCHDRSLSGCNLDERVPDSLSLDWTFSTCRILSWTTVVNNDGYCFFADACETLYCVCPEGERVWKTNGPAYRVFEIFCGCALDLDGDNLYVAVYRERLGDLSVKSRIYCFDSIQGDTLWYTDFAPRNMMTPLTMLSNGSIVVGLWGGATCNGVYCYSESGQRHWLYELDVPSISKIAADSKDNIYFSARDTVYSIDSFGDLRWKRRCPGAGSPMVFNMGSSDCLCVPRGKELVCAKLDGSDVLWKCNIGSTIGSVPTYIGNGKIVIGAYDGKVYCIDREGEIVWSTKVGYSTGLGAFAAGDGRIYGGCRRTKSINSGMLFALDYAGKVTWRMETSWSEENLYSILC